MFSAGKMSRQRLFPVLNRSTFNLSEPSQPLARDFARTIPLTSHSVAIIERIEPDCATRFKASPMLVALVTRRGGALRSCLQQCGSKQQFRPSSVLSTERIMSRQRLQPYLVKKKKKKKKKSNSSEPAQAALPDYITPALPTYTKPLSYADRLISHGRPTLLFQSSSITGYLLGCYTLGGVCFAYALVNFNNYYLNPPEGVWTPIPIFLGSLAVFMIGVGIFFFRRVSCLTYE